MYPHVATAAWSPFPESAAGFYYLILGFSVPLLIAAFLWLAYSTHRSALARESAALERELKLLRLLGDRAEHGVRDEGQAAQERPSGEGATRLRRGNGHGGRNLAEGLWDRGGPAEGGGGPRGPPFPPSSRAAEAHDNGDAEDREPAAWNSDQGAPTGVAAPTPRGIIQGVVGNGAMAHTTNAASSSPPCAPPAPPVQPMAPAPALHLAAPPPIAGEAPASALAPREPCLVPHGAPTAPPIVAPLGEAHPPLPSPSHAAPPAAPVAALPLAAAPTPAAASPPPMVLPEAPPAAPAPPSSLAVVPAAPAPVAADVPPRAPSPTAPFTPQQRTAHPLAALRAGVPGSRASIVAGAGGRSVWVSGSDVAPTSLDPAASLDPALRAYVQLAAAAGVPPPTPAQMAAWSGSPAQGSPRSPGLPGGDDAGIFDLGGTYAQLVAEMRSLEEQLKGQPQSGAIYSAFRTLVRVRAALALHYLLDVPRDMRLSEFASLWVCADETVYPKGTPRSLVASNRLNVNCEKTSSVVKRFREVLSSVKGDKVGLRREHYAAVDGYLKAAAEYVGTYHPKSSSTGRGDPAAGSFASTIPKKTRDNLAEALPRHFLGLNTPKIPAWCGRSLEVGGPGALDMVWLLALLAWRLEEGVQQELGVSFRQRVVRRYTQASGGCTLPITPGPSAAAVFDNIYILLQVLVDMEQEGNVHTADNSIGLLIFADAYRQPGETTFISTAIRELVWHSIHTGGSETLNSGAGVHTVTALSAASAHALCSAFTDWVSTLGPLDRLGPSFTNVLCDPSGTKDVGRPAHGGRTGSPCAPYAGSGGGGGGTPRRGGGGGGSRDSTRSSTPVGEWQNVGGRTRGSPGGITTCFKCGGPGHKADSCPNPATKPVATPSSPAATCLNCYQTGHAAAACTNPMVCSLCKRPGHKRADCGGSVSGPPRPPTPGGSGAHAQRGVSFSGTRPRSASQSSQRSSASQGSQISAGGTRYSARVRERSGGSGASGAAKP